jgi:MoaA/NifB/PqqE/SkfB family radical SAM enzyme
MGKKRFGHIEVPLQRVHIELTNICEFNCVFCPKVVMDRPPGYMDAGLAKRVLTELKDNGICEKVTFHVMGEPTLHKDFFGILAHARNEGLNVGLTTNGAGLRGETGKRLLEFGLHQVDISLQTPDASSFRLRKPGALGFEEYAGGIMDFFRAYKASWPDTVFKFRFLNTRFRKKGMEKEVGPIRVISSTDELRETFRLWAGRVHDALDVPPETRRLGLRRIGRLVSYKWNVVEVAPSVFFETYILSNWGHAFGNGRVRDAWAGYCYGMRDHFSVLYNGDVALCCLDYNGRTAMGNLHESSLAEVLSSDMLGKVVEGFGKFRVIHPYCRRCLGSGSFASWLLKPVADVLVLKMLKPFFYSRTKLHDQ